MSNKVTVAKSSVPQAFFLRVISFYSDVFLFQVASSDATNIESSIILDGDHYIINGHKWWTSG